MRALDELRPALEEHQSSNGMRLAGSAWLITHNRSVTDDRAVM